MTTMQQPPNPPSGPPPGHGHGGHDGPGSGHGGGGAGGGGGGGGHGGGPAGHGGDGHGHTHSHGPAAPVSRHLRRIIAAVVIPFAAAVVVGLAVLWPGDTPDHKRTGVGFDRQTQSAEVTRLDKLPCSSVNPSATPPNGDTSTAEGNSAEQRAKGTCSKATVKVTSGKDKGRTFTEIVQPDSPRQLHEGQKVVVAYAPDAPRELQYSVTDVNRKLPLVVLAGLFALVVVVVGRMRGVMALVALAVSFLVLTVFILPAILQGSNPLVVAVVGASAIMLVALYLCHGFTARTSVAVLGTLASLLLIGLLGSLFIDWAALTGNTDDNTGLIHGLYPDLDMSGLLLAGVIIGSLGVLDDVTVTQTSAVWELHQADPGMGRRGLYRAAIRIGRDHIASVVNTLVLAYAGAALPLLLLFSIAQSSVGTVANSELVAEEIVRTLIGSIGLVASVPMTTALAALVVSADKPGEAPVAAGATAGGPTGDGTGGGGASGTGASAGPGRAALRGGRGRRRKR
ncbi:YibE/F family protein [Streptomyces sp. NA04227]|uniref:YibE/F family protein n=1 Tax=Streptomyces sp. NA04227 TaxID=2742136 RepID=UPI00158FFC78|nr:YibE/F family protein [Streptomyces sp. NA04227]QKW07849.1 YibE/F family protein [Streptomyces sp. NA04227]